MILHEIMFRKNFKMIKNTNNLFKTAVLMKPDEVLCKICFVEYSY
jgi:hypothetical protein